MALPPVRWVRTSSLTTMGAAGTVTPAPAVNEMVAEDGSLRILPAALGAGREVALGAACGFLMSLFLIPAKIAGSYLGHEAGLQMASLMDPNSNTSGNVLSEIFDALLIILFFAFNAHHYLLYGLDVMFRFWPVGGRLPQVSPQFVADRISSVHHTAFLAVLPAVTCLFVSMCGMLILMRSTPQFSLFSIGQSLRVGMGLLAVLLFLPHTLRVFAVALSELKASVGF